MHVQLVGFANAPLWPIIRRAGVTALVCLHTAVVGHAQSGSGCVPDTGSVVKRLTVGISVDRDLAPDARELATAVATQIGAFVDAPTRVSIDRLRGPSQWTDASGTYHSEGLLSVGQLVLDLAPSGRAQRVALDPGTGSPEVDRAVLGAAATADSSAMFPPAPSGGAVRRVRLWLLTAAAPDPGWIAPLFLVSGRVPANATAATVQSQPAVSYPPSLLARQIEGDVVIAFAVDEQGQVPDASIRVLSADDSAFIELARQSVREGHYVAATVGGCAVRSELRQRVRFRVPAGAAPDSATVLADAAHWFGAQLPKLTRALITIRIRDQLGGTGITPARVRVSHASLDHCQLTIDRVFEVEYGGTSQRARLHEIVPLNHVDRPSVAVQQHPLGSSFFAVSTNPWRVVAELTGGVIRSDFDFGTRRASEDVTKLDLVASDRDAAFEIATHLRAAIAVCH